MTAMINANFRCGHIAIVGRPNVGKSTLLNQLVGEKISIVSSKVQTTRMRVRGINTTKEAQFIYIDTPGYQQEHSSTLNTLMNRYVESSLGEVDVVLFVVEAMRFGKRDSAVLKRIAKNRPCIAVVNKIDPIADKATLLPYMAALAKERDFIAIVPISAELGTQVPHLQDTIAKLLPLGPPLYDEDALTDRSDRFMAAELVREKVFRFTGDEIPYGTTVLIEQFEELGDLRRVFAAIVLDNINHKPMILGKGGARIKQIASAARQDMEKRWGGKVYLELFVKVKSGWHESKQSLESYGYDAA